MMWHLSQRTPSASPPDSSSPLPPAPPPPAGPEPPQGFWRYLYTQNPFYVVSAVLMLFAVRSAYGTLEIGFINTWVMWGVLAGYTLLLAGIAVAVVRWGRVWDDARSLLLLLVVLMLAVSIGADDLFVRADDADRAESAALLVICGYLFSAIVTEAVLLGCRIRIGWQLRLPYHGLLALFYAAPWFYSTELNQRDPATQSWMLLAFPVVAAGLFLLLWPAARSGPESSKDNGTPYPWPWFPWTAFGVFAVAVGFRSYVLCMTYGLQGPIWGQGGSIVFDTIWGPYFLVPLAVVVLLLVLEATISIGRRDLQNRVLAAAPLVVGLALPLMHGIVHRQFLRTVTDTVGSPLWLSTFVLIGFYLWAAVRRIPAGVNALLASLLLLVVIGPRTIDARTMLEPTGWPLAVIGAALFVRGLRRGSSGTCTAALVPLAAATWLFVDQSDFAAFRFTATYHVVWLTIVALGLVLRDDFARVLRVVGAVQTVVTAMLLIGTENLAEVPIGWRIAYVLLVTAACFVIANLWRLRSYLVAFYTLLAIGGYAGMVVGFRAAVAEFGRPAVTAFSWSLGTLLLAFVISAHKARWIDLTRIRGSAPSAGGPGPNPPIGPRAD